MQLPKKECIHIVKILEQTKSAILKKDSIQLKKLSDQTIHDACSYQDEASITIGVLLYSLSKIIEREDYDKIKSWEIFVKKFNSELDLAVSALEKDETEKYQKHIRLSREILQSQLINFEQYISNVLKKAAINKGSKIYSHGLSLEQTAKLLGTNQWELSEYIGQRAYDEKHEQTLDVKKRAKMALEFFG